MKITFDVDPRTASALLKYAARWSMTPGEIIDGLMRFYKREMKERYNHEQLKLPSITAPQCRTFVPDGTAEVQAAIDTVQEVAGLEEQTIEYLLRYQYGEQLVKKLAEAMEK